MSEPGAVATGFLNQSLVDIQRGFFLVLRAVVVYIMAKLAKLGWLS